MAAEGPGDGIASGPSRAAQLRALADERFDLLVVGGGSVGSGIALLAAAHGLRVALVEAGDFASGTSSRSTKLIHGGVRYLERAVLRRDRVEYRLVREALRERAAFFRTAPFLCRRLAILTPAYTGWRQLYHAAGLRLYDWLAGPASLGRTEILDASQASAAFPALRAAGLRGAVRYYDGQFDDARFNVLLVLTAAARGATVANYCPVRAFIRAGQRLAGAEVEDELSGARLAVRARILINAAGPFADAIRSLDNPHSAPVLRPSSGVHLVVDGTLCPPDTGLLIPETPDGRVVFILPWLGHTLIGTTDQPAAAERAPAVAPADVAYLLHQANRYLSPTLGPGDVRARWSGIRPLVQQPGHSRTAELARDHVILDSPSGLITVVGGKWTTYRRIAADALAHVHRRYGLGPARAQEAEIPLRGAAGYRPELATDLAHRHGLPPDVAAHLATSYGRCAETLAAQGGEELALRLVEGFPYVAAEIRWAVRQEMAVRLLDVLARRLRLAFLDQAAAERAIPAVAVRMAEELGWSPSRRAQEEEATRAALRTAI